MNEFLTRFFTPNYQGPPFQLFGTVHLLTLLVIALAGTALILWGRRADETTRRRIRYALAALLWLNELGWHLWKIAIGQWSIQTMLPLHLCSVMVWLSGWMLIKNDQRIYIYAYLLGIGGALQALLTPDVGIYNWPHYRYLQTFTAHGLIVIAALYMTLVENHRPRPADIRTVILGSNLYALVVFLINRAIGSNYLYINGKPASANVLDMLPPWPWYLPWIEALGLLTVALLYAPFFFADRKTASRRAAARTG